MTLTILSAANYESKIKKLARKEITRRKSFFEMTQRRFGEKKMLRNFLKREGRGEKVMEFVSIVKIVKNVLLEFWFQNDI